MADDENVIDRLEKPRFQFPHLRHAQFALLRKEGNSMKFTSAMAAIGLALLGVSAQAQTTSQSTYSQSPDHGRITGEVGYVPPVTSALSMVSRGEVLQALAADGPLPTAEGTDLGAQRAKSLRSRSEVHAEAVHAVRTGTLVGGKV